MKRSLLLLLGLTLALDGWTQAKKIKINPAPAADLHYAVKAKQGGLTLNGDTVMQWRVAAKTYSVSTETRAMLAGKILEEKSEGGIDEFGLAPLSYTEKRFRKGPTTATFDRAGRTIRFTESQQTYPIKGGEQDRASAMWQLISIARTAPARFKPGSNWSFFVAGQRDADPWTFRVVKQEKIRTALGDTATLHVTKAGGNGQQLDIWLAPAMDWYPVRLRLAEPDGEYVEQNIMKVEKK